MRNPIKMRGDTDGPKTAIICTLAPAQITKSSKITSFIKAGMRIARLNFSHVEALSKIEREKLSELRKLSVSKKLSNDDKRIMGNLIKKADSHNKTWRLIRLIRNTERKIGVPIGIMMDLCGPRLRTGNIRNGGVDILKTKTNRYTFISEPNFEGNDKQCSIFSDDFLPGRDFIHDVKERFENLENRLEELQEIKQRDNKLSPEEIEEAETLREGLFIYVNDGRLKFKVIDVDEKGIHCEIIRGGLLESRKGVNVPYCDLGLPSITTRDSDDLRWVFKMEQMERKRTKSDFMAIDFVAASFVKENTDITTLRGLLKTYRHDDIPIIPKIETTEALKNLEQILRKADGVMVARGDLGVEISLAKVPRVQRKIIETAKLIYGESQEKYDVGPKFVIVATQMLESMIGNVQPLRAEVADINTAVMEGADGIMTSAETIQAEDPIEVVKRMAEIAREAERERDDDLRSKSGYIRPKIDEQTLNDKKAVQYIGLAESACILSQKKKFPVIVVSTWSGRGAKIISSFKPCPRIIAITDNKRTMMHLLTFAGVCPVLIDTTKVSGTEDYLALIQKALMELGLGKKGNKDIVTFFGIELGKPPIGPDTTSNTVRLFRIP